MLSIRTINYIGSNKLHAENQQMRVVVSIVVPKSRHDFANVITIVHL